MVRKIVSHVIQKLLDTVNIDHVAISVKFSRGWNQSIAVKFFTDKKHEKDWNFIPHADIL